MNTPNQIRYCDPAVGTLEGWTDEPYEDLIQGCEFFLRLACSLLPKFDPSQKLDTLDAITKFRNEFAKLFSRAPLSEPPDLTNVAPFHTWGDSTIEALMHKLNLLELAIVPAEGHA